MNKDIQKILDTNGFIFVANEINKWISNKEEQLRAYSPEEKSEIESLKKVYILILNSIDAYK